MANEQREIKRKKNAIEYAERTGSVRQLLRREGIYSYHLTVWREARGRVGGSVAEEALRQAECSQSAHAVDRM